MDLETANDGKPATMEQITEHLNELVREGYRERGHDQWSLKASAIAHWLNARLHEATANLTAVQAASGRLLARARRMGLVTHYEVSGYDIGRVKGTDEWLIHDNDNPDPFSNTFFRGSLDACFEELKRRGVEVP